MDTNHEDGTYRTAIEMDITAEAEGVRTLLLDFENYISLHDGIKESRILDRREDGTIRARFVFMACVLFFCKNITYVMDFHENGVNSIIGDLVPGKGDFSGGYVSWSLEPLNKGARLMLKSEFKPTFWIPPVIGPYFVGRTIKKETLIMMRNVERKALKEPK